MTNPLKNELKHFEDTKEYLLRSHKDQFALIKGSEFVGAYTTFEEAFESGVEKFGNEPFLVKQVSDRQTIDIFMEKKNRCKCQHCGKMTRIQK